jgi:hypothetical protein
MGTNYYAIPKVKMEEWQNKRSKSLKEAGSMKGLIPLIKAYYDDKKPQRIHVGKSSCGWKFLFNHNDWKYFEKTQESLKEFLSGCHLIDEYEREIGHDEFWEKVRQKENDWDDKAYYEQEKYNVTLKGVLGIHDKYHDGLRFSTSTDFC